MSKKAAHNITNILCQLCNNHLLQIKYWLNQFLSKIELKDVTKLVISFKVKFFALEVAKALKFDRKRFKQSSLYLCPFSYYYYSSRARYKYRCIKDMEGNGLIIDNQVSFERAARGIETVGWFL